MNAPHTPGPWRVEPQGDADEFVLLTQGKGWLFAFRQNWELMTPTQMANARLIAAAPDLLDLVVLALPYIETAIGDPLYKSGAPKALAKNMRAAIERVNQS